MIPTLRPSRRIVVLAAIVFLPTSVFAQTDGTPGAAAGSDLRPWNLQVPEAMERGSQWDRTIARPFDIELRMLELREIPGTIRFAPDVKKMLEDGLRLRQIPQVPEELERGSQLDLYRPPLERGISEPEPPRVRTAPEAKKDVMLRPFKP